MIEYSRGNQSLLQVTNVALTVGQTGGGGASCPICESLYTDVSELRCATCIKPSGEQCSVCQRPAKRANTCIGCTECMAHTTDANVSDDGHFEHCSRDTPLKPTTARSATARSASCTVCERSGKLASTCIGCTECMAHTTDANVSDNGHFEHCSRDTPLKPTTARSASCTVCQRPGKLASTCIGCTECMAHKTDSNVGDDGHFEHCSRDTPLEPTPNSSTACGVCERAGVNTRTCYGCRECQAHDGDSGLAPDSHCPECPRTSDLVDTGCVMPCICGFEPVDTAAADSDRSTCLCTTTPAIPTGRDHLACSAAFTQALRTNQTDHVCAFYQASTVVEYRANVFQILYINMNHVLRFCPSFCLH
jgi:hypothetical protein